MPITLTIEGWPPSANRIWRSVRGGNILSEEARKFYRKAPWEIKTQAPGVSLRLPARLSVTLGLHPPTKRPYDIDNRAKAVLDALTKSGIIEDDRQIRRLVLEKRQPMVGGRVTVEIIEYAKQSNPALKPEGQPKTVQAGPGPRVRGQSEGENRKLEADNAA